MPTDSPSVEKMRERVARDRAYVNAAGVLAIPLTVSGTLLRLLDRETLLSALDAVTRERDEVLVTLANERGEGEPPSVGWLPFRTTSFPMAWVKAGVGSFVGQTPGGWRWASPGDVTEWTDAPTARAAMIAADLTPGDAGKEQA